MLSCSTYHAVNPHPRARVPRMFGRSGLISPPMVLVCHCVTVCQWRPNCKDHSQAKMTWTIRHLYCEQLLLSVFVSAMLGFISVVTMAVIMTTWWRWPLCDDLGCRCRPCSLSAWSLSGIVIFMFRAGGSLCVSKKRPCHYTARKVAGPRGPYRTKAKKLREAVLLAKNGCSQVDQDGRTQPSSADGLRMKR